MILIASDICQVTNVGRITRNCYKTLVQTEEYSIARVEELFFSRKSYKCNLYLSFLFRSSVTTRINILYISTATLVIIFI